MVKTVIRILFVLWYVCLNILGSVDESYIPWIKFPAYSHDDEPPPLLRLFKNNSAIQGMHISIYDTENVLITWLHPARFNRSAPKPVCLFTVDGTKHGHAVGRAYTYSYNSGCFASTLNSVVLEVSQVTANIFQPVSYSCGNSQYGMSQWFIFHRQTPKYLPHNDDASKQEYKDNDPIQVSYKSIKMEFNRDVNDVITMEQELNPLQTVDVLKELMAHKTNLSFVAVVGDMSAPYGDSTIDIISKLTHNKLVKLLVHAGDISYADKYGTGEVPINNSYVITDYMNTISEITTQVPYMTCPGNHEEQFNFTAFRNWFPTNVTYSRYDRDMYYSFDYMGIHFVMMSTEHDFSRGSNQNNWIISDLQKANKNRQNVPWIIVVGHRPLYCTSSDGYMVVRCTVEAKAYRYYLEDIFKEQHVDVYMCGHNHDYERTYPVYKERRTSTGFINPNATIYIVNGEAGNVEGNKKTFKKSVRWRARYNPNTHNGFLLIQPMRTQLKFIYIDTTKMSIVDKFRIRRL